MRNHRATAALTGALLGATTLLGLASPAPAATPAKAAVRVGTYNVFDGLSKQAAYKTARHAMRHFDVVGLQEWEGSRRSLDRRFRAAGWGVRNSSGDATVAWRHSRFRLLSSRSVRLVGKRYVGGEAGRRIRSYGLSRKAEVVRLAERRTGRRVTVVDAHLPAHISSAGRRSAAASRARLEHYSDAVHKLARVARTESAHSSNVLVTSDTNVDWHDDHKVRNRRFPVAAFARIGFVSNWAAHPHTRRFTIGHSLFDQVFADRRPSSTRVLTGHWASDHKPVLATYRLR